MELAEFYAALGQERSARLVQTVSIGALKTFGVYDGIKIRSRLRRFNRLRLRRAAPRLWERITAGDHGLARELSQAVLVSSVPLMVEVLDLLGIDHNGSGFFDRDSDFSERLGSGWQDRVLSEVGERYPRDLVLLYINHLGWEAGSLQEPFLGTSAGAPGAEPGRKE